ncbi:hypothetical protein SPFM20_00205 [Salmonella phage SPFM20]|nr:hypothetical protein SPFM20_00205 [Salmonella phage SPFM20]
MKTNPSLVMMRNPKLDPYECGNVYYIPKSAPFKANILNKGGKTVNLNDRTKHASASHLVLAVSTHAIGQTETDAKRSKMRTITSNGGISFFNASTESMETAAKSIRDALNKQIVLNLVFTTTISKIRWKLGQLEHRTPPSMYGKRLTVTDYLLLGQRGFLWYTTQLMVRTRLTKQDDIFRGELMANDPSIPDDLDMFDELSRSMDSHFQECERYVNSTAASWREVLGRSIRGLKPSDIGLFTQINEMAMDEDIANLNSAAHYYAGKQNSKNGRAPTLPAGRWDQNEHLLLVATAAFFKLAKTIQYVLLVKREDMPNTDIKVRDVDLTKYVVIQSGEPQYGFKQAVKRYAGVDVTIWPATGQIGHDTDEKPLMYWLFGRLVNGRPEQLFLPGTSNLFVSINFDFTRKVSIKFCKKPTKIYHVAPVIHQPGICREHGGIFRPMSLPFIRRGGLMNYYGTTTDTYMVMASFRVPGDPRPVQSKSDNNSRNNRGRSIINISSGLTVLGCRQMSPFEAFIFKLATILRRELTYDEIDNPKLPERAIAEGVGYTQAKDGIHDRVGVFKDAIRKIKEAGEIVPFNHSRVFGCRGSTRWDDSLREA